MRINPEEYEIYLYKHFSNKDKYFELMCQDWSKGSPCKRLSNTDYFIDFIERYKVPVEDDWFRNCLQEWSTNLEWYWNEGVLFLFQHRNHDWGTPEVRITKADVGKSDVDSLRSYQIIYRGMCHEEHLSGNYRQSWTLKKSVALRFAKHTYQNQTDGIVAKTKINRNHILYYDKSNHKVEDEDEVIIEYGSISKADVTICN